MMKANLDRTPRILIAGVHFETIPRFLIEQLPEAEITQSDPKHFTGFLERADVLIPTMTRIDRTMIRAGKKLRLIQQWGSGLEGVDQAAADELGVAVANVPTPGTGNAQSVAEWCVMAAISLSRAYPRAQESVQRGISWGVPCGQALSGRTAGIVGLGGIGTMLARRLQVFDMRLIGVKRSPECFPSQKYGFDWVKGMKSLTELLQEADYIFLCLPLNPETSHLIGFPELPCIRPGAYLINPSRGGLIDRLALQDALSQERLGGVALDVFWEEPTQAGDPLYRHPRVLATPHIAGVTDLSYRGIAEKVARNVCSVMAGKLPDSCANPEVSSNAWWFNGRE